MSFELPAYCKRLRLEKGLNLGQTASRCGYKNLAKGANKLHHFENQGEIEPWLLKRLVEALEIDPETAAQIIHRDREYFVREWNAWADQPIKPRLIMRAMPAVFIRKEIPANLTTREEIDAFATDLADKYKLKMWLILSRRTTIYFDQGAKNKYVHELEPGDPCLGPRMTIGGKTCEFLFRKDIDRLLLQPPSEPTSLPADREKNDPSAGDLHERT